MSAEPVAAVVGKPKRKKLLVIVAIVVVLLAVAAAAAFMYVKSRSQAEEDGDEETAVAHVEPAVAPTFLPLENMVVNLADTGGERFAQIGITLEVADAKTAEKVKTFLPAIRSGILLLISQRTASEILKRDGKDQLAEDIRREVARPLGYIEPAVVASNSSDDAGKGKGKKKEKAQAPGVNPVKKVLFSSFIIQ